MTIGERIKARRIELNLTQDELAKKAGYKSRSSINKLESSRTLPSKKIEKMANALETTPGYLMGWVETFNMEEWIKKESEALKLSETIIEHLDHDEMELIEGFRAASDDRKDDMLEMARKAIAKKEGKA